MRKSFILHIDSLSILDKMPDDIAGKFIKILYEYQITSELPEMDFALEMAVTPFINQFKRDSNKYKETVERNRINGLKGGRPKKQSKPKKPTGLIENPTKPKKAYNDSKSDSDNNNDSKNDLIKNKQKDFQNLKTITQSRRKEHFLETFNLGRKKIMNKESNFNTLPTYVLTDLNNLYDSYTLENLKNALAGLFMQKNALPLVYTPKHFLKDGMYETYLDAYQNKNKNLYNQKNDIKNTKKGML